MMYALPPQSPAVIDHGSIAGTAVWSANTSNLFTTSLPTPAPPLPPEARKDPHTFCAGIMYSMDVAHPGWRTPWESDWAHAPKEVPEPVSVTIPTRDATLVCRQDGTFSIEERKP